MRLTAIILLAGCLQVAAKVNSQTITFSAKNADLQSVFKVIEKQTGFIVAVNEAYVRQGLPVNIDAVNMPLEEFLSMVFKDQPLSYSIEAQTIFLSRKLTLPTITEKLETKQPPVTGVVKDSAGAPLAGATIANRRTKKSVQADVKGEFTIEANEGDEFVISFVGFESKSLRVSGNRVLVILIHSKSPLDEIQIIGYGQTSKRFNTGNVATVKGEEIEKQPVNNPLYALQGRVPGLVITPKTGLAGGAVNIQLRGKNSLRDGSNGNLDPLIVVDGLPIANNVTGLNITTLSSISTLSFLNPNEIESIDILKDADATSIYGSRGANGVILLTTKKGRAGKARVDLNVQSGVAKIPKKVDLLNTQQYLEITKEAWANAGIDFVNTFPFELPEEFKYLFTPALTLWDQSRYTDWQKKLVGGSAQYQDAQASISGGGSNIIYIIGGNYHKETTVFPGNNKDQKGSVHFSLTSTSDNQKLKASISGSYLSDHNTLPNIDYTKQALTLAPNAPAIYNTDGSLNWVPIPEDGVSAGSATWDNPGAELLKSYDAKIKNLVASGDISYKLFPFLTLRSTFGYNELNGNAFLKDAPLSARRPEEMGVDIAAASFRTNSVKSVSIEPQINFNENIDKGVLSVLAGGSIQNNMNENQGIGASGFTNDALLRSLNAATNYYAFNSSSQYRYNAIFGRVNYNYSNKYLLSLNARHDGSSRFGPGKQFGNFGSVGAAWIFSEENSIKKALPFMSFGKLRYSYGSSGNDGIGDYQYLERYTAIGVTDPYQGARGYITSGLFNSYYAWEETRKMELGLETGFINNRILFNISYFRNRSDNQLINYPYPTMAGPGTATVNLPALIQNMGVELTLNSVNIKTKNFFWSTSANFTRNRNKLVSFPGIENSAYRVLEIGKPFSGVANVFSYFGVDQETGRAQFRDIDGNVVSNPQNSSRIDGGRYMRVMVNPKFYGGVANTFSYKGFNLDIFFQFTKQLGTNPLESFLLSPGINNLPTEYLDRWQKPGDNATMLKLNAQFPGELSQDISNMQVSNWNYVDASFIRLKNLSLSYSIPAKWREGMKLKNMKLYVLGQNLLTITNYKGLDPETQSMTALPPLRVITAGVQVAL